MHRFDAIEKGYLYIDIQTLGLMDRSLPGEGLQTGGRAECCRDESGYVAAKHGVVGLTKSAALEYADTGLQLTSVCPGILDRAMTDRVTDNRESGRQGVIDEVPIGRTGEPEEIANAVLWPCSEPASRRVPELG